MRNQWTGGQYSVARAGFGVYLVVYFVGLLLSVTNRGSAVGGLTPFDPSWVVQAVAVAAIVAAGCFIVGVFDRVAAIWMLTVLGYWFGCHGLTADPAVLIPGWLLLVHVLLPKAPYGSWSARRRIDPAGDWSMPNALYLVAWMVMAIAYSYSGYTQWVHPAWGDRTSVMLPVVTWAGVGMALLVAPLALVRVLRPFLWLLMVLLHLVLGLLTEGTVLSPSLLLLHLVTFDPGWVPARYAGRIDTVFYDGYCGLCHRVVRFLLAEDQAAVFRFAPLQSQRFAQSLPQEVRNSLPDSLVVLSAVGAPLTQSDATIYILHRLGGLWRLTGLGLGLIPHRLRELAYAGIAAIRYALFQRPEAVCPLLPVALQARFLHDSADG